MDRGKKKMTADDVAAEHRAKKRNSQIASGESLRLQPSPETLLIPENETSNTMLQQHLDTRYIPATENVFNLNPRTFRVSAPMSATLAPQYPCTIPASAPTPLQLAPQYPCTIPASAPMPLQLAPQITSSLSTAIPTPHHTVEDKFFDLEGEAVDEVYRVIDDAELLKISDIHNYIEGSKEVTAILKATLGRSVCGNPLYACDFCDSLCKYSNGLYTCSFCGVYSTQIPKKISKIELLDCTGKLIVHVHPDYMDYLENIFTDDPVLFRITIQDWEGTSIAFVANFIQM